MVPPPKPFDDEEEEEEGDYRPAALTSKKKWDDEEDDEDILDSWDAADDSEEERKKEAKKQAAAERAAAEAAANKKSSAERIAEKKAAASAKKEAEDAEKERLANETPAERRAREQARELEGDMRHAEDLFGAVGIGAGSGTSGRQATQTKIVDPKDPSKTIDLSSLDIFNPITRVDFNKLQEVLAPLLATNMKKAHYNIFLQEFTRAITKDLPSEQIKTLASKLTALSNEKQKEEKAAEKGAKKKVPKKAGLGAAGKEMDRIDTRSYEEDYNDFDDFM